MDVTQDILLPVLVAAIIANTVLLLLVVFVGRVGRGDRVRSSATRSVLQGGMMSSSFVDHSARSTWEPDESNGSGASAGATGEGGEDGPTPPATTWEPTLLRTPEPEASPPADPEPPAATDPLTGLLDHAAFTRLIAAEDLRIQRYHRPATVVIFEVEGLDRLAERLGPESADRIVPALADTMRRLARDVDQVARLAPRRFGVLLPETDEIAAINYVERVRRACELWLESGAIALDLAAGWAGTDGDPTLVEAVRIATDRMYVELRREARRIAAER